MNNFRVVLYGLAVAAAVCVGESAASSRKDREGQDGYDKSSIPSFTGDIQRGKDGRGSSGRLLNGDFLKNIPGANYAWEKKFTLVAAAVSSLLFDQEEDERAALVDSAGVGIDKYIEQFWQDQHSDRFSDHYLPSLTDINTKKMIYVVGAAGINFGTNYGIRKIGKYLNSNGISVKSCLGDSTVVKVSTDVVMHSQMLTFLFWATVNWLGGSK